MNRPLKVLFCLTLMAAMLGDPSPASGQAPEQTDAARATPKAPADPVERRVNEFRDRTQRIQLGEATRAQEVAARRQNRQLEIQSLRSQLNVALSMPPASGKRSEQIDQTFASLRNLVDRLLDDRKQATEVLLVAESDLEEAMAETLNMGSTPESRLANSLALFIDAHEGRVAGILNEIDATSALLIEARILRRQATANASETAQKMSQEQLLADIMTEVHAIPIDIESAIRRTASAWWRSPAEIQHVQALGGLFLGLTKLALLLVFGIWSHSRLPTWVRRWVQKSTKQERDYWNRDDFPPWVIPGDVALMAEPLGRFSQDLLVATFAALIFLWTQLPVPLLAWVSLIFFCGAAVRLVQGVIELSLITSQENRPGLAVTDERIRAAMLWLTQAFGLLFAIHIILNHLLIYILGADGIANLFGGAIRTVSLLLGLVALVRWSELLRSRVSAGGAEGPVATWVVSTEHSRFLKVAGAAIALILIVLRTLLSIGNGLIESRAGLEWLSTFLARRQLKKDVRHGRAHLPLEARNAIGHGALRELGFDASMEEIKHAHQAWKSDPRRGLFAITGDRGSGKDVLLEQLKTSFDGRVTYAAAPLGHTSEPHALKWLIDVTNISAEPNVESVIEALKNEASTVFLLSNIHRLFLRAVSHYQGLDSVLDVMQATARHHFWVASFHGPAWSFLNGMKDVGHVGIFQRRIHIGAMKPIEISSWLKKRTAAAGYTPDFSSLLQRPTKGPDRDRMLERTERAFWRLLTDGSQGNPTVATRLWVDCLQPNASDSTVSVGLPRTHDSTELDALSDGELFVLTAIILHDDISVEELHYVLNESETRVRAICRGLEQATLIMETDMARYKVRLNWLPAVERHLRRRSFLHKS